MDGRTWSSAIMSLGFAAVKAPLAMKSMWSVATGPCLVLITLPSIKGSRSRCTPSALGSEPAAQMNERHSCHVASGAQLEGISTRWCTQ